MPDTLLSSVVSGKELSSEGDPLVSILRDLPDAVLMVGRSGNIFYANSAASELFGFKAGADGHVGSISDILPAGSPYLDTKNLEDLISEVDQSGRINDFEIQLVDKDRKVFDAISIQTAIRDGDGKFVGISAVIRDVTKTKESEGRIFRRNAQLFALIDVAEAITQMSDVETLLSRVLNAVLRVMSLNSGCVHLLNDSESLRLVVKENLSERVGRMLARFELGEGLIGQTAVLAETLLVSDTASDRRLARPLSKEKIGSLATIPLIGQGGAVLGVMTLFHNSSRDFTEHEKSMLMGIGKQVGVALERAELMEEVTVARAEWEETFEAMTDGVSIHSPSGKIKRANASLAQMYATSPENLIGKRCCELYHGSPKPRPDCTIMRTVTERVAQKVELQDRIHGRVLRVITDPIVNAEGRVVGVVCTTRDVTDEKLIERRMVQQERVSAIGEISAGIAHEVGTPLNIISANVEFLIRNNNGLAEREEVRAIREQISNITQLFEQLLDFSRERPPHFAAVNINDLIKKTLSLLNHQLENSNVKVLLNLAPYLPTVDGDASQIQPILFNLITNARQAMETNVGRDKVLSVTTDTAFLPNESLERPHIVIKISDNGRGIEDGALPNVFNAFFTANKKGGTGLGLAISHRIVQRHQGSLTVENNPDHGVTAAIRLPLAQA